MVSLLWGLGLIVLLNSISADACFCTADYKPYCGTDEKTYSNKCQLECAQRNNPGLRVKFEGVCAVPYQPDKGGSPNRNSNQGAESQYRPQYVLPPRPNTNNYFQQSNQQYNRPSSYLPSQQANQQYNRPSSYLPSQQTYPTPSRQYYPTPAPPRQYFPTVTPRQYYPTPTPRQYYPTPNAQKPYYPTIFQDTYTTLPPKQTYTAPPRQTYYQPRPTTKPYQGGQEQQSWVPPYGG